MDLSSCGVLETQELGQLCDFLSNQISGLRLLPLWTAGLSALTTFAIAWFTWSATRRVARDARRNTAQRESLLEIQNIALKLRNAWLEYHQYVQRDFTGKNPFDDVSQARMLGKFDTALARVDNEHLRGEYKAWSEYAEQLYSGSPVLQESQETLLWKTTVDCSGTAIRRLDRE